MVASVLPGMVVSMLLGIRTLKPSIAVDTIIEGICGCQCSSFKSLWPCSHRQSGSCISLFTSKIELCKKNYTSTNDGAISQLISNALMIK
jgi:hypothetical protein